jgi:CheY-like chemotaxis protein
LAEDNEANQELMKIILAKYALTFDVAQNGKEAYELFVKNKYDLILMDEQMPIMDGIESSKKIIAYEKKKRSIHTPIISLSANVMKKSKKDEDIEIFSAFLSKPIVLEELEKIFTSYLCLEVGEKVECIEGFDKEKLLKELMLSEDELFMLLNLFIKKMHTILPQLQEAIKSKEYKQIALKAHSVKGSSANFRMEDLVGDAAEIEAMAKKKECDYDYMARLKRIETKVAAIEASL